MDAGIDMVLDTVRTLTRDNDGVIIEVLGFEDGVLTPDSFRDMVERMCSVQAPHVGSVVLVPAR